MNSQNFYLFFIRACMMPDSTELQLSVLLYWMCFFKVKSGYFLQGHHFHGQLMHIINTQVTMTATAQTGKATL